MLTSVIDKDTVKAYQETHYKVEGDTPMTLLVGTANNALAALHEATQVESSAFVTACNPFSKPFAPAANAQRQEALAQELTQLGFKFIDAIGQHPASEWVEPSFLALGLSLEAAKELGSRYEQSAIIWVGSDAVPQLVLLR